MNMIDGYFSFSNVSGALDYKTSDPDPSKNFGKFLLHLICRLHTISVVTWSVSVALGIVNSLSQCFNADEQLVSLNILTDYLFFTLKVLQLSMRITKPTVESRTADDFLPLFMHENCCKTKQVLGLPYQWVIHCSSYGVS